jgi:DNA polymerase
MRLYLDFETRSDVDIRDVQAANYAEHESTRALILAWAIDDYQIEVLDFTTVEELPPALVTLLSDPAVQKVAWNAPFEIAILLKRFGVEALYGQWLDPMILARYITFPASLAGCSAALGLDVQKDSKGKLLIKKFSMPSKATAKMLKAGSSETYWKDARSDPADWAAFLSYCRDDVDVMRECLRSLETYPVMPKAEWNLWRLDQMINLRGMPVDALYVANASVIMQRADTQTMADLKELTRLPNPNSITQMKGWLDDNSYPMESLAAECVDAALLSDLPEHVRAALLLKQRLSGAGPKKLAAIQAQVSPDGLLRNQFNFYGGHTGRWTGRAVQVQNLPRPDFTVSDRIDEITDAVRLGVLPADLDVSIAVTSTVRSSFRAPEGHHLVIADFASIENRILAWLANCQAMLRVYREGRDAYKDFAVKITGHRYEDISKQERTLAKPAVLGCGYGMSAPRLAEYAASMGISMTEEEAAPHVKAFREGYPEIPVLWNVVQRHVFSAVRDSKKYVMNNGMVFDGRDKRFLRIGLHSGRDLFYLQPEITVRHTYYGTSESMRFKSSGKAGLQMTDTYGAKLVENIVQALARDLLCTGLKAAVRAGFDVIAHVHDEIVCDQASDSHLNADELARVMSISPSWGPDLLLAAEGSTSAYYRK